MIPPRKASDLRVMLPAHMLEAGHCIAGRYRLVRLLGRGGMGEVWQARNESVGRDFALKVLTAREGREGDRKRLLREARAAGQLRHPNIVEIFDAAVDEQVGPYLVMELLEGCSLARALQGRSALPLGLTLSVGRTIAGALHVAHETGVTHRDLKPANIFVHRGREGVVLKLVDFGISKMHAVDEEQLTIEGMVLGSPLTMSPEQAVGRSDVDRRTDLWSLGALLYRMVTGRFPFRGATPGALLRAIVVDDPAPVRTLARDVPDALADLIERCLRKEPNERPATAQEIERTLATIAERAGIAVEGVDALHGAADETTLDASLDASLDGKSLSRTEETPAMLPAIEAAPSRRNRPRRGALLVAVGLVMVTTMAFFIVRAGRSQPMTVRRAALAIASAPARTAVPLPSESPSTSSVPLVAPPRVVKPLPPHPKAKPPPPPVASPPPKKPVAPDGTKHADF